VAQPAGADQAADLEPADLEPGVESERRVDGRTRRAERTRTAIVAAHLALLNEGDLKPTADRVAERAGISVRALWTHFRDLESLFAATGVLLGEAMAAEFTPVDPGLPLPERVEAFCRQRVRMMTIMTPAARAARVREPFSQQLRDNRVIYLRRLQAEIRQLFAAEFERAGQGAEELLHAVTMASTWSTWVMMLDELTLTEDAALGVMRQALTALFASAAPSATR
jgi:AcrR family transcriptional regulator